MPPKNWDKRCVVVYFNPEATDDVLDEFQTFLTNCDDEFIQKDKLDYSVQGYSDGFGRIVQSAATEATIYPN